MPENISNIAKYNIENGTHFWKLSQVNQHKQQKAAEEFEKKHPILASFTKSAQDARDAKIGAIGAGQVRDLYNTGNSALASELNQKYLGANATGILNIPIGSEIATYGLLGGGLRLGAGTATGAAGSWLGGKAGDLADKQFGTNWIGTAGRIGGGFAGFVPGMNAATRILKTAAGKGVTLYMPQNTFMGLRGKYFTNAGNKALVNLNSKSNPILTSTINHLYKEYPELSSIGPKEAYRQYYETIFPASKVQTPYVHGTKSDLSVGLETSVKIPNAAAPETIGRNDFYLNLQPETSLQYADGIGVPEGFTWNKHRYWPLKEILGKPYKSDAWMSKPIKLREQVPNRAGQFSRVKNADGTYTGHGKLLEEYKAELGMQDLSNEEFLQKLGVQNEESFNQWVEKNRQIFSDIYNSGDYHGLYHVKIDANKPLTINGGNTYYSERGIWDKMNKGGNDVLLHNNAANEFGSDVAVVRDVTPQKVRILGSKPDQQGFIDFMGGKQQFFTEIPTSPQETATTYHFDGRIPLSKPISEAVIEDGLFSEHIPIVKRDNFRNPDIRYKQGGILKAQKGNILPMSPLTFAKYQAYKIVADPNVWWKAGANWKDIAKNLFRLKPVMEDQNKSEFIFGVKRPETTDGEAYDWAKDIEDNNYKNVKSYEGILNPYNEYIIGNKYKDLVKSLVDSGYSTSLNINDEYSDPETGRVAEGTPYFDDVHGYRIRFHRDKNGNPVISASDLYDFGKNYTEGFQDLNIERGGNGNIEWQRKALNLVGQPYKLVQHNIPIKFVDDDFPSNRKKSFEIQVLNPEQ